MLWRCVQVDRTERIKNCLSPRFSKTFVIDYYFEVVQKLKFGVYDIDNKTVELSDDDFLGECECTLGQVSTARRPAWHRESTGRAARQAGPWTAARFTRPPWPHVAARCHRKRVALPQALSVVLKVANT